MALTKRQKDVLDFIADFVEENGYSPSYEELAQGLKLASLATVHKHIQALEARNYLRRLFNQSRSLEVSPKYVQERRRSRQSTRAAEVPLAGRIAAGSPVEAIEGQDTLQFADFAGKGDTFALQVTGESMMGEEKGKVKRRVAAMPGNQRVVLWNTQRKTVTPTLANK